MSTIIRVKRSLNEDPLDDKIVLNCKRQKIDQNATILKFAGTVEKSTNIQEHLTKITKDEAKDIIARKNLTEGSLKNRLEQNKEQRSKNRFKIVNLSRPQNEEEVASSELTILDVEKDILVNNQLKPGTSKEQNGSSSYSDISDEGFVYDIYISDTPTDILKSDSLDINELSVLEYNDYLYSCPRLMNEQDEDSIDEDDSDENDENNWRNDYPDEEELSENGSIDERHMRRAMENFDIENDLSSDEYDENGFVYSVDSEGINFEDDLDYCNVNRYGEAYARYRRRNLRALKEDEDNYSDDSFHSD